MLVNLKNGILEVVASSKGAEVLSVKDNTNLEYMHQIGEDWNRTSPNLFPFIGCLTEAKFEYKGVTYPNLRHGFLRDLEFETEVVSDTKVNFHLKANEELLAIYPFDFELVISHELVDKTLTTSFKVTCLSEEMYFGLGTHAGFNTNYFGTKLSDYVIKFEKEEDCYQLETVNGLVSGNKGYHLKGDTLTLNKDLFLVDSLLFDAVKSKKVVLESLKNNIKVEVSFADFDYLCIWSPVNCENFVCIEPWCSSVGKVDGPIDISKREDLIRLTNNESFEAKLVVTYLNENK